jgi:cytochrome b subunit of formate dehydrogenase
MKLLLMILLLGGSPAAPAKESAAPRPVAPAAAAGPPAAKPPGKEPASAQPAPKAPKLPPPKGSQVKPEDNFCFQCHTNTDQMDPKDPKLARLYVSPEKLKQDVHFQKGVSCTDCHGGNYDNPQPNVAHAAEDGFSAKPEDIKKLCSECHKSEGFELSVGVHGKAGPKNERGAGTPLACDGCHGPVSHHLLPARDNASPVFLDNQVRTCGGCHEKHLATYNDSVHGKGLHKSGLAVTAACADCHGSHGIYYAVQKQSRLNPTRIAATCGKCHRFIAERLQHSVHGGGGGPGTMADRAAPGGKTHERPNCTSCHQGHDLADPESAIFRQQLPNRCGNCHGNMSHYYAMSMHGELTALGYGPAAKCSDCHGAHEILAVDNPDSTLSKENRPQTCGKCHQHLTANFVNFDPHADPTDSQRNPVLYWVYTALVTVLVTTFCIFGAHSFLWFVRGLIDVLGRGRPRGLVPGETAFVRFTPYHRVAHLFLLLSFLGLALTGLPLKYSQYGWAKTLAYWLGGFESTGFWHRVFALGTFGCFVAYIVRLARTYRAGRRAKSPLGKLLFGPDSLLPRPRDFKDFARMLGWFLGLSRKPTFERWAYWEKFDFWGACSDIIIIGSTGLILWFPNVFCSFLPGLTLNFAKVIHSTLALLATGFVFAIHFFSTHFRAEKFPADLSVLVGLVSEEEMEEERPEYLERLRREGKLDGLQAVVPARRRLWLTRLGGFLALAAGLGLLLSIVVASLAE